MESLPVPLLLFTKIINFGFSCFLLPRFLLDAILKGNNSNFTLNIVLLIELIHCLERLTMILLTASKKTLRFKDTEQRGVSD